MARLECLPCQPLACPLSGQPENQRFPLVTALAYAAMRTCFHSATVFPSPRRLAARLTHYSAKYFRTCGCRNNDPTKPRSPADASGKMPTASSALRLRRMPRRRWRSIPHCPSAPHNSAPISHTSAGYVCSETSHFNSSLRPQLKRPSATSPAELCSWSSPSVTSSPGGMSPAKPATPRVGPPAE